MLSDYFFRFDFDLLSYDRDVFPTPKIHTTKNVFQNEPKHTPNPPSAAPSTPHVQHTPQQDPIHSKKPNLPPIIRLNTPTNTPINPPPTG